MNEKQLAKLIKQTAEKAAAKPSRDRAARKYDDTLRVKPEAADGTEEHSQVFKEMKKREF